MSEPQPQTDPAPPKGQTSARGSRGRHHYEGGRTKGEEEGERRERKDGGRKEREREEITLDTVIPEKPKKAELLKEPSEDEYEKKYEEFTNQIETLHEKYHKYVKEMEDNKVKNKDKTQTSSMPLKEILKTKIEEKKRLNDEFRVGREMAEKLKNDMDNWVKIVIFSLYLSILSFFLDKQNYAFIFFFKYNKIFYFLFKLFPLFW